MTWARHESARLFCRIDAIDGGSVHTACLGRWSASDPYETRDIVPVEERCGGCENVKECEVITIVPRVLDWDVSDVDAEMGGES